MLLNNTVEPLYNEHLGPDIFSHSCISKTCRDQNFCPYYGGFFYCVLNSEGLREVPLYNHLMLFL